MSRHIMLAAAFLICIGCAPTLKRDRAFTENWAFHRQQSREEQEKPAREIVLLEKGPLPRAVVSRDEQGETRLRFGENSRWSTDVGLSGGKPEMNVEYKVEFDH